MPIFEYACPQCRRIYSFLSKRLKPERLPICPRCGHKKLTKALSRFSAPKGSAAPGESSGADGESEGDGMPPMEAPRMERFMREMERDMSRMDENNPRHMAQLMRKWKDAMPGGVPREMDEAIRRLEKGEDPDQIEADLGEALEPLKEPGEGKTARLPQEYSRDAGLYDL